MLLDSQELDALIEIVRKQFGIDLSNYAKSSLQRRFHHLCVLNGLLSKSELFDFIHQQSSKNNLVEKITVSTTEMFRDPSFWHFLRKDVLKKLAQKENISIWHLACSSGEEVVSMNILLQETGLTDKSSVEGSDLNTNLLQKAKMAVFPEKKMNLFKNNYIKSQGEANFESYFDLADPKYFAFKQHLMKNTNYSTYDVVLDTCKKKHDLILCRNVMIYFNADLQARVLQKLSDCLNPGGFLALGHNESILKTKALKQLEPYYPQENIFRIH